MSIDEIIKQIPGYDPFSSADGYTFESDRAEAAINFFAEYLTHVTGPLAGQPYILETHEKAILANLFGWYDKDGARRYRECFYYVPRKNSKSTFMAGVLLYILYTDDEPHAQIYGAAATREQAGLVFDIAKGMVLNNPVLENMALVQKKIIEVGTKVYKAISADANTSHGYNTHCAIIDELHAQKDRDLVDVLLTSTGVRKQPLIIYTTTADFCRESICNEMHDYACKVRDGVIDNKHYLPVIYETTPDQDWRSPETWAQCNPMLGKAFPVDFLEKQFQKAVDVPAYENTFKRLHLNMKTEQADRWLPVGVWDESRGEVDEAAIAGEPMYLGVDLSSTSDITAVVGVIRDDQGRYNMIGKYFIPGENAHARERRDGVPYTTWARQGYIELTEGNTIDLDRIRNYINELSERHYIAEIAIDRWNAQHITTQLQGDGFDLVPFGQGFASMSGPTKHLEKIVRDQDLVHGGDPVMRWMLSNVAVETDAAENIKPNKKRSSERIDGIVALVMAIGRAMVAEEEEQASVYESRGILTL